MEMLFLWVNHDWSREYLRRILVGTTAVHRCIVLESREMHSCSCITSQLHVLFKQFERMCCRVYCQVIN
jgi:hypothetical protein